MSALPDWMTGGLTAEAYEALPEEVSRGIEIVDGAICVSPAPTRRHQDIGRRLANALESVCGPELRVSTDVDLRLADVPLLNRRPDVVVYRGDLPDDAVLRPADAVLVAEVTSPGSVTLDRIDKPAEYAAAGVRWYWRVDAEQHAVVTYALGGAGNAYVISGEHTGRLVVTEPVRLDMAVGDLLRR